MGHGDDGGKLILVHAGDRETSRDRLPKECRKAMRKQKCIQMQMQGNSIVDGW